MRSLEVINGSVCYVSWKCLDVNGNPYTPTSLTYTVWNVTDNVQVGTEEALTPAQSGTLMLDSSVNTMSPANARTECRQVTLKVGVPGGQSQPGNPGSFFRNDVAEYVLVRKPGTP